jgi:hypothetical protein
VRAENLAILGAEREGARAVEFRRVFAKEQVAPALSLIAPLGVTVWVAA